MFRNFVNPAALERTSTRQRDGSNEHGFSGMFQTCEDNDVGSSEPPPNVNHTRRRNSGTRDVIGYQPVPMIQSRRRSSGTKDGGCELIPTTITDIRKGYSTSKENPGYQASSTTLTDVKTANSASNDVHIVQQKTRTTGTNNTNAEYKTSIYINGTVPKSGNSPNVQFNQNQNYQQHSVNKSTEVIPNHRSGSLTNTQLPPISSRPDYQKRPSITSLDMRFNKNDDTNCSTAVDVSNDLLTNLSIDSQNIDFIENTSNKSDISSDTHIKATLNSLTNGSCDHVPEIIPSRQRLYLQEKFNIVPTPPPLDQSIFVGLRDIRNPASVHEKQIVSVKGTVRGFQNRVRAGIATFWAQSEDEVIPHSSSDQLRSVRSYRHLEHGKIVIYATSMSVVRETDERCRSVRRLLQNHMVRYEERDLYMSQDIQQELQQRLAAEGLYVVHLPHVFADGIHIGGAEELEKLNEAGELRGLLDNYQKVIVRIMCDKCGGYRFMPCEFCHGSKKSLLRNHFTEEFCALRCMHCDDNGLRRCDMCVDQQE